MSLTRSWPSRSPERQDRHWRTAIVKKLINDPTTVVTDALAGIEARTRAADRPRTQGDLPSRRTRRRQGRSHLRRRLGHEPLHGGFVGVGMLDAACAGQVFTSPTPDQMHEATKVVDAGAGVLHIVKNYTGDVLNFEMAAELAAEEAGIKVEAIVTNDDVAVEDSLYTAGRRGVGVTVLLEKICGAAARTAPISRRSRRSPTRSTGGAGAWAWRSRPAPFPPPESRPSSSPRPRWRSGSGSTASPVATANRSAPRPRSPSGCSTRSCATFPTDGATSAGLRQRHGRYTTARASTCSPRWPASWAATASPSNARWWAPTSRRWRWPAARSRCSSSTTNSSACGTPVRTPALRWGVKRLSRS